ncbi:MAG: cupin-like domain-containing protein [Bacteroidota bacterium]
MDLQPIERRTGLTSEEFVEEYQKKGKPVVFTDLVKDWPAAQKWTFDYMRETYGHIEVPLFDNDFRKAGKDYLVSKQKMKFGDYLTLIQNEPTELRMFLFNIFRHAPELVNDIKIPTITKGFLNLPLMFFGGEGSKVDLHYDLDCAAVFLTQFQTRKKVILFDHDQSPFVYKHPFTVQSSVMLDAPDYEKHPALKMAKGYETTLQHGETVYMPSHCWHYIYYVDGGFSLSLRAHTNYTKVKGALSVAQHFVVDKSMNMLLGQRWSDMKENMAQRKATLAMV